MGRIVNYTGFATENKLHVPVRVVNSNNITNEAAALIEKPACVSFFGFDKCFKFEGKGSWILLDFGKELCGSARIVTRNVENAPTALVRITFGESVTEACSRVGESTATNDHSPRDFEAMVSMMSDLTFGASGFRFIKVELLEDKPLMVQNIFAESREPYFSREATIKTSDERLNEIIDTAAYTLKLNLQNGYIWDGIKRDRLVWSGDLHQEVINSLYLFGDNIYIKNSLEFLKDDSSSKGWINGIPTYSAWWVINFCDYCAYTGNDEFFKANYQYAKEVLEHIDSCISEDGVMTYAEGGMQYFLDWPTCGLPDAEIGTAAIMMLAANKVLSYCENESAVSILRKLNKYLDAESKFKQTRAFQIIAGRKTDGEAEFLEDGGAKGFSTFMAYYILTAYAKAGGKKEIDIIKHYFGAMLDRGATTFWEDFDLAWLEGSGRIDDFTKEGEKDLHADYGNFCYKGLRHSLCHGWSSGVLAFIIESVFGIKIENGCTKITVKPNCTDLDFNIKLPIKNDWLEVNCQNGELEIKSPEWVSIVR